MVGGLRQRLHRGHLPSGIGLYASAADAATTGGGGPHGRAPTTASAPTRSRARRLDGGRPPQGDGHVLHRRQPTGELRGYLDEAFWRFLRTWDLARAETGRALELGANPYFITWLLREMTPPRPDAAATSSATNGAAGSQTRRYLSGATDIPGGDAAHVDLFNMEEDAVPLRRRFVRRRVLLRDPRAPAHGPTPSRRGRSTACSRPGGLLVLTTPNVARLDNVLAMVGGAEHLRPVLGLRADTAAHNREYTRQDLVRLLAFAGFEVETIFTGEAHAGSYESAPGYGDVAPLLRSRADDLGQYLFAAARSNHAPSDGLPTFLTGAGRPTAWSRRAERRPATRRRADRARDTGHRRAASSAGQELPGSLGVLLDRRPGPSAPSSWRRRHTSSSSNSWRASWR